MKRFLLMIMGCFFLLACGTDTAWADWVYTWERVGNTYSVQKYEPSRIYYYYDGQNDGNVVFRKFYNDKRADGKQNYATLYYECEEPAKTIKAEETVSMKVCLHGTVSKCDYPNQVFTQFRIFYGDSGLDRESAVKWGGGDFHGENGEYRPLKTYKKIGTYSETIAFSAKMPGSTTEGETISVYFFSDAGMFEWKYRLKKTAEGEPASERGDTGVGSASDTNYQPDSSCTFDVAADSENQGYYIKPEFSEYTVDLNGDNLARINCIVSSYTENKYISPYYWVQNGKDGDVEVNDYNYGEVKLYDDGVYAGNSFFEFKGVSCGTAVIEFYVNAYQEGVPKWYNRKFVTINVVDSSQPKLKEGIVLKDSTASYKVLAGLKTVSYTAPVEKSSTTVTIPATVEINGATYEVTAIAANAFKDCSELATVTIGANVETIGKNAFNGCTKLKTVKGCKGVTSIGASAFQGCSKLTSMAMGSKLTIISDKAFFKCTALTKITIPAKVTKIGKSAFQGCKKLKTITIKTTKLTAKKVGAKAFTGTAANATVKVPKKSLKAYKTWLTKKGINKKAKIKS